MGNSVTSTSSAGTKILTCGAIPNVFLLLPSMKTIQLPYSALPLLLQGCQSNHFSHSTASSALSVVTGLHLFRAKAGWLGVWLQRI